MRHRSVGDLSGRSVRLRGLAPTAQHLLQRWSNEGGRNHYCYDPLARLVPVLVSMLSLWPMVGRARGRLVNELGEVGNPADIFGSRADVFFVGIQDGRR